MFQNPTPNVRRLSPVSIRLNSEKYRSTRDHIVLCDFLKWVENCSAKRIFSWHLSFRQLQVALPMNTVAFPKGQSMKFQSSFDDQHVANI